MAALDQELAPSPFSNKCFHDEAAAFVFLEKALWKDDVPKCPHCQAVGRAGRLNGKATRIGLWKCYACRKQFTVKVGTVFEAAHIPLHKILRAVYLIACTNKGVSTHRLHRVLEIKHQSAWFLARRVREAMRMGALASDMIQALGTDRPRQKLVEVVAGEVRRGIDFSEPSRLDQRSNLSPNAVVASSRASQTRPLGLTRLAHAPVGRLTLTMPFRPPAGSSFHVRRRAFRSGSKDLL